MNISKLRLLAAAGLAVASFTGIADAQSIASTVNSVRDGKVRMTFASRSELCGFGKGVSLLSSRSRDGMLWVGSDRSEDVDYDQDCMAGPARVVIIRKDGRTTRVRSYIGGRWRSTPDTRDLGTVSTSEAASFLLGVADTGDEKPASDAVYAATLADSVNVYPRLVELAENDTRPQEVRGSAIFGIGQSRRAESGDYLRKLYPRVRDEKIRDRIIFSMSQQRDAAAQQWLMNLATDSREPVEMRKKALFWAGQTGASFAKLAALYDRMGERELREQMIFVFSQRKEPAAIEKLIDIAKNDADRNMRSKALFWIGQSKDERVTAFLTDIINR